jgi:hypothetical protein
LLVIGGICCAFGPQNFFSINVNYFILMVSRFLVALGTIGMTTTGYVLGKYEKQFIFIG